MATFRITNVQTGSSTNIIADDDFQARKKLALRMSKKGRISYASAWAVVSPSRGYVKVERISDKSLPNARR